MFGRCKSCNGECPFLGYDADRTKKTGDHYLKTNSQAPFCGKCLLIDLSIYLFVFFIVIEYTLCISTVFLFFIREKIYSSQFSTYIVVNFLFLQARPKQKL